MHLLETVSNESSFDTIVGGEKNFTRFMVTVYKLDHGPTVHFFCKPPFWLDS